MSWALSCLQLKKFYKEIELVTDKKGKQILIDELGLPYSDVSTVLENSLKRYPDELWSLAKVFSYSMQEEPFIHLDGDVFLWECFNDQFLNADVIAQNLEINLPYYEQSLKEIYSNFQYQPDILKQLFAVSPNIYASNTGIFGGKDIQFIKFYCQQAFRFIDQNIEQLNNVNKINLNFIFEQCFLYYLAGHQNRTITYFINKPVTEPSYTDYAKFTDVPAVKFIHTVGGYKRIPVICEHLSKRLRKEYPEYYYRIIGICKQNGISLKNSVYSFPKGKENNNELSTTFFRTFAALEWLGIQQPASIGELNGVIANTTGKKERLEEIFGLENKIYQLSSKLKEPGFVSLTYQKDVQNYLDIENLFQKSAPDILHSFISVEPSVIFVELNHQYSYNPKSTPLKKFIEKKMSEDSSFVMAALVYNPLKLSIDEFYLDQADMVIVYTCQKRIMIGDALEEIKEYFDTGEVNDNYEDYKKLVLDSVKRLMYNGILSIANE